MTLHTSIAVLGTAERAGVHAQSLAVKAVVAIGDTMTKPSVSLVTASVEPGPPASRPKVKANTFNLNVRHSVGSLSFLNSIVEQGSFTGLTLSRDLEVCAAEPLPRTLLVVDEALPLRAVPQLCVSVPECARVNYLRGKFSR